MRFRPALLSLTVTAALLAACGSDGDGDTPASSPTAAETTASAVTPAVSNPGDLGVIDPQRPKVRELAPDFALVDARDGSVRKLSDFRGKAVVLNWFASWCDPCQREIPEFQAVSETHADVVTFIGVNYQENAEKAIGTMDELGADFPVVLDSDGDVGEHYRATGLPTTYFIDAEGVVRGIRIGEVKSKDLQENLAKVNVTYDVD